MTAATCRGCGRGWSVGESGDRPCAWCGGDLEPGPGGSLDAAPAAERAVLPAVDARQAASAVREAVSAVPHPGPDLLGAASAVRFVWLPVWQGSAAVRATATAVIGQVEEVAPPAEGWVTGGRGRPAPVQTRTRWHPTTAAIDRTFEGLRVDALADPPLPAPRSPLAATPAVDPLRDGPALLPDRSPRELAPALVDAVRAAVAEALVAEAPSGAVAVDVTLPADPLVGPPRWTLVWVPAWVCHYRDDDGRVRTLVVDAVRGGCHGPRLGSRAVASAFAGRQTAIGLALAAFAAFLAVVGVLFWLLLPVSAVAGLAALRLLISARSAGPAVSSWNRTALPPSASRSSGGASVG